MQTAPIDRYDLIIVGDFSSHSEDCWRVGEEVRCAASAGYRIGLVSVAEPHAKVHPDIAACLFEGLARPLPLDGWTETRLLLIVSPHSVGASALQARPHIRSRQSFVVLSGWPGPPGELAQIDARLRFLFGELHWTATTATTLAQLSQEISTASGEIWPTIVSPSSPRKPHPGKVVGAISFGLYAQPPPALDGFRVLQLGPRPTGQGFAFDEVTLGQFLSKIDYLACYDLADGLPHSAIGRALHMRIPVLLPPELRTAFEQGPIYVRAEELGQRLERLQKQRGSAIGSGRKRVASAALCSPTEFVNRLLGLIGPATRAAPKPTAPSRRIFLVSSNGIGIGHLTRLISVARRLKGGLEPVFVTFSQGVSILEQFGYPFRYMPSQLHAGIDYAAWNRWLRAELDELLAAHDPAAIVFDGNNPYPGLLASATHQPRSRLCWIRRGLWRPNHDATFLNGGRFFDLIIEPDDVASTADRGITAQHREEVLSVPPIRLLEDNEVLTRAQARKELGLNPKAPAVLIQLGSGGNRDIAYLIDVAVEALSRFEKIQIAVVEWLVGTERLKLWPAVRLIRGFPVSRYANAFDFTIAASAYNTFNETISNGLPAIFIPNEHASMDDQSARAAFAEVNGAGFHLPEGRVGEIAGLVETLMDPTTRALIRLNALRIAKPNGASAAAEAIQALAGHG
ncbi:MAG TPA: glycosyltransferase [Alphaproteobacteria bacterium]|nr:glycosyltransferase [Alphaproteobacteria bacterium]